MTGFTPIGALIDKALDRTGVRRQVETTVVLDKFNELCYKKLGEESRSKVQAIYIKNKILTVACLNSVFAQEIQFNVHIFIKEINDEFGDVVERVRFLL